MTLNQGHGKVIQYISPDLYFLSLSQISKVKLKRILQKLWLWWRWWWLKWIGVTFDDLGDTKSQLIHNTWFQMTYFQEVGRIIIYHGQAVI